MNPRSWTGSVCVGDVNIKAEWKKGQMAAKNILCKYFGGDPVNFDKLFSRSDHNLLKPLGKYVRVNSISDDAHSEEENSAPLTIRLEENSYSSTQAVHLSEDSFDPQEQQSDVNSDTNESEEDIFHNSLGMAIKY